MSGRLGARLRWMAIQLRRLGDARAATVSFMVLVLATTFLFGLAPRLAEKQAGDALRTTVNSATADIRNIAVGQTGRLGLGSDPMTIVGLDGEQFQQQFPASVNHLVSARYAVVDTPRFRPQGLEARTVRLRYLEGATDHLNLIAGRFPTGRTGTMPTPAGMTNGYTALNRPILPVPEELTTFEVALSSATADNLKLEVGDKLALSTDQSDKLAGWSVALIGIDVVGIYETRDAGEDYWFDDTSLDHPQIRSLSQINRIDDSTVLVSADAYGPLLQDTLRSGLPFRYTWRFAVDPERLRAADTATLLPDLRRMESVFVATSNNPTNDILRQVGNAGPITLQTGLARLIGEYVAGWRSVSETLSVVAVGGGAVALLALSLICLLAGRRRDPSMVLWLSRGASPGQFLTGLAVESATVVVPPVVVGAALAFAAIPDAPSQPTYVAVGAILLFAVALVVWDGRAAGRDPGGAGGIGSLARGARARAAAGGRGMAALTRGASPRRLFLEGAVVAAAIAGAYLLHQRGVAASGADAATAGPDPVSAAIPVLIGGAGALVAVRLLPLPLDLLSRLAERGRGIVAVLALRRATRRANDRLLLTSLLTMAAVWSFAVASLSYLDRSASAASWQEVGAGFRVALREGTLPEDLSLDRVPGVEKIAYATELTGHVAAQGLQVSVLALDLAEYEAVARGGWPEGLIPSSMLAAEVPPPPLSPPPPPSPASSLSGAAPTAAVFSAATADPSAPIPVIVSTSFAEQERLGVGDTTPVVLNGAVVQMSVAEILESFPTLDVGTAWIIGARGNLSAVTTSASALGGTKLAPTEAFIRAGESAAAELATTARYQLPGRLVFADRYEVEAGLRGSAGFASAVFGLTAVSLAVALYGALAVLAALLLSGAERAREAAHLRVLGLTTRQESMLGVLEHGPTSLLMVGAGIALGMWLFAFLLPGLGLAALVGGQVDVGLSVEPLQVGLVAAAVCLVVGVAIAMETVAASIIEPAVALRRGLD
jgi:hypothetical protein